MTRIATGVKDGKDDDLSEFLQKMNDKGKSAHHGTPNIAADFRKESWIFCDA